ncbi:hypothetical protein ACWIUD_10125 [Helicobacter sp. 23-1044]
MKNRIKKRRDSAKNAESNGDFALDSAGESTADSAILLKNEAFLYNLKSIGIIIEMLIGAILGIALCFGFFFAFFVVRGSLLVSLGIFFIILIIAAFAILVLKCMFVLVGLKLREIRILEKI